MSRGCVQLVSTRTKLDPFLMEYAHIREKAFPTNVESAHVTHKEMILIQKDTQFLGLGKNHETTEVAAVEK